MIISEDVTTFEAMDRQIEAATIRAYNAYCDWQRARSAGDFDAEIKGADLIEASYTALARIVGVNPATRAYFDISDAIEMSSGPLVNVIEIVNRLDGGWTVAA